MGTLIGFTQKLKISLGTFCKYVVVCQLFLFFASRTANMTATIELYRQRSCAFIGAISKKETKFI